MNTIVLQSINANVLFSNCDVVNKSSFPLPINQNINNLPSLGRFTRNVLPEKRKQEMV